MKLRTHLARLAAGPLRDARIRALIRQLVPAGVHSRARLTFEAAIQPDGRGDLEQFHDILSGRRAVDGVEGRTVLVCGALGPGGAERQIVNTLQGLSRAGVRDLHLLYGPVGSGTSPQHDFFLARAAASGAAIHLIRPRQHRTLPFDALPGTLRAHFTTLHPLLAANTADIYSALAALRPGVVHAWLDWTNIPAGFAAVLAGVPRIVLSGRSLAPHRTADYAPFMDSAYRALCAVPGVRLINNSRAGADDYAAWLGLAPGAIEVIYNGVDGTDAKVDAGERERWRRSLEIPPRAAVVGGIFRFDPVKRPLLWLHVAAAIAARRPGTSFVILGEGALRAEMASLARRLGLAAHLRMPGVTSSPWPALRAIDAVLLTSVLEGTPNAALEAQWCGVPVIGTRVGGLPEAVAHGETGWLVDSSDAAAIADRVVATLNDDAGRERMRQAGPRFIAGRFGLHRMIDETLGVYGYDVDRGASRFALGGPRLFAPR